MAKARVEERVLDAESDAEAYLRNYEFELRGITAIFLHQDDVEQADEVDAARKADRGAGKRGDDRFPAWTWTTYVYHDGEHVAVPQMNLMKCLSQGGSKVNHPARRGNLKSATQSGLMIVDEFCEFDYAGGRDGKPRRLPWADVVKARGLTFKEQADWARSRGFALSLKRVRVGTSKHVRVRPVFSGWRVRGTVTVTDPVFTDDVLADVFNMAGNYCGLGDWRPSSKESPGPYGRFRPTLKRVD